MWFFLTTLFSAWIIGKIWWIEYQKRSAINYTLLFGGGWKKGILNYIWKRSAERAWRNYVVLTGEKSTTASPRRLKFFFPLHRDEGKKSLNGASSGRKNFKENYSEWTERAVWRVFFEANHPIIPVRVKRFIIMTLSPTDRTFIDFCIRVEITLV